ncbi:aminoglycoside phosphotransferase family protein [Paenibacillus sp. FSL W8-1187]|uniref:Putative GTPase related to EngC n=1 Tax=Paenibacillus pasadenensis TaxID=217090 RepID=A0A2N5N673_9BACL|nr:MULTISPECIES: aminoglycoside phosphotransferase family protein [Paenibacillus]PLT45799.1 putative GTPase related to EngC [Paenibacillus pasadenensis]QGG56235.1 phosphotransferase [Paenibacillus sp. B01]
MDREEKRGMEPERLAQVLSRMLGKEVIRADCRLEKLHGGTLGDVQLAAGIAETADGNKEPYRLVWKTQKRFERHGDPLSWRREYDLYAAPDLDKLLPKSFRRPACYRAELNDEEIQLWLEYIDGRSGMELTTDMQEQIAREWGRIQGRLYAEQPAALRNLPHLSQVEYTKNGYLRYRSWQELHARIRSDGCGLPKHLRQMLIDFDEQADAVFSRIEQLPVVLCHRDFWVANLFHTDDGIVLIDWDTAGWGYMGEDIASLIADEADVPRMIEIYRTCVPAYLSGFNECSGAAPIADPFIYERMLMMYGYRLAEWHEFAGSPEEKRLQLDTLQQIYDMKPA